MIYDTDICNKCMCVEVCEVAGHYPIDDCEHFKNKADFVEIPCRCKDCNHRISYNDWDRNKQTSYTAHECRLNRRDLGDDGFCSSGEKK